MRRIVNAGNVALAVLGIVTIVLLVLAVQKQNALEQPVAPLPPTVPQATAPQATAPSVAFIGDSFTSGTRDGGLGPQNWTAILAQRNGWTPTDAAVDGAGYVAAPPGGGPFSAQLPRVMAAQPGLVVVVGARADVTQDPAAVRAAADALFRDLRSRLPRATVVAIGPIWPDGDAPEEMLAVRTSVRDAAAAAGIPFIDPLRDAWFQDPGDPGITGDRQHLNDVGHKGMADLVGEGLRRLDALPT